MFALGWIALGLLGGFVSGVAFGLWPTFILAVVYGIVTYYLLGDK
jgi:hypothetical protein